MLDIEYSVITSDVIKSFDCRSVKCILYAKTVRKHTDQIFIDKSILQSLMVKHKYGININNNSF